MVIKKSLLQQIKTAYRTDESINLNKHFPSNEKELDNYRHKQIALQYCNEKMKHAINKKTFCKEHQIGINTLNNSLEQLGFKLKKHKKKLPRSSDNFNQTSENFKIRSDKEPYKSSDEDELNSTILKKSKKHNYKAGGVKVDEKYVDEMINQI